MNNKFSINFELKLKLYILCSTQINDDIPVEDRSTTWGYAGTDFAPNTDVVLSFSDIF